MLTKLRVAYYGIDRFGAAVVMMSHDYKDPARPGWSRGITQSFIRVADLQTAEVHAKRMKQCGMADLVQAL